MTMRKDCEDWVRSSGPSRVRHFWRPWLNLLWAAAYRAGQAEMRERAAQLLEVEYAGTAEQQRRLHQIAGHIRALDAD